MRILHTSDWHLGRSLHRVDLTVAHAAFFDHLVETVRAEQVELVCVSGDVFDRAIPPVTAIELYDDALARLRGAGAALVLTSGNHDSAVRLGANAGPAAAGGVHLRTRADRAAEPVLLHDEHGPVAVHAVPYLEPVLVRDGLPAALGLTEAPASGHAGVLGQVMRAVRSGASGVAPARTVVMAHGWVTGGEPSDSERDLTVGGVAQVPASAFDGMGYVALGHLHGRQTLAEHLRYSGSPLAFSFSEARHTKGCWLVELGPTGPASVEFVPAPVPRLLAELRGTLAQLLTDPALVAQEQSWLSVTLTDDVRPQSAKQRLDARFPHVLHLQWLPDRPAAAADSYTALVRGRSDEQVVGDFVEHVRTAAADAAEQALLTEGLEAVRVARDADRRPATVGA